MNISLPRILPWMLLRAFCSRTDQDWLQVGLHRFDWVGCLAKQVSSKLFWHLIPPRACLASCVDSCCPNRFHTQQAVLSCEPTAEGTHRLSARACNILDSMFQSAVMIFFILCSWTFMVATCSTREPTQCGALHNSKYPYWKFKGPDEPATLFSSTLPLHLVPSRDEVFHQ